MRGAVIRGNLCLKATVANPTGTCFSGERMEVSGSVVLKGESEGNGIPGTICLSTSSIEGDFRCTSRLVNPSGPALAVDHMDVKGDVILDCHSEGAIRLEGTHAAGRIVLSVQQFASSDGRPLMLDGLTYTALPSTGSHDTDPFSSWSNVLKNRTVAYADQPWRFFAVICRELGRDDEARKVLISQQDDRLKRVIPHEDNPQLNHIIARLSKLLTGYGYNSWRSLIGLSALIVIAVLVSLFCDSSFSGSGCHWITRLAFGLEWSIPIIFTSPPSGCSPRGSALILASWIIKISGWVLTTLFVTGFTGIIRKTHD